MFVNWSMLPAISRKIVKIWAERKSQRFHEIFADPLRSITFLKKFVCACEVKIWAVEPAFSRKIRDPKHWECPSSVLEIPEARVAAEKSRL